MKKQLSPVYTFPELPEIHSIKSNRSIVFTNGVFDIIHSGHIHLLTECSSFGDFLIVGLNSDSSVKRLKGNSRPINDEKSRARLLSSLIQVDAVIIFDQDTPLTLIQSICPDVLVKGGDYTTDQIVGAQFVASNGGKVITVETQIGFSTTNIINKSIRLSE